MFLVIGLGSIGRRHARNLRSLLGPKAEIIAYRSRRPNGCAQSIDGIRQCSDLDQALALNPPAALICNPTSLHVPAALEAAKAGCHLLIEKPVSHTRDGLRELQDVVRDKNLQTLVGFQFRFHPGLIAVHDLLREDAVGEVIHVSAHWGEYLPGWHPWEDYRIGYSARRDLGGGVILTLSHPFDYLRWLIGEVKAVTAVAECEGDLGIDVEDTADIFLEFESGATGTVHLNYIEQPPCHQLRIIGRSGTILWDNETGDVRWYRAGRQDWRTINVPAGFERNSMFLAEARHFLDCMAGRAEPVVSLQDGIRTLDVALAIKASAEQGTRVEMRGHG